MAACGYFRFSHGSAAIVRQVFELVGGSQHVVHRLPKPRRGLRSWCDPVLRELALARRFGAVARFGDDDARLR
jgi:hypothetical protein